MKYTQLVRCVDTFAKLANKQIDFIFDEKFPEVLKEPTIKLTHKIINVSGKYLLNWTESHSSVDAFMTLTPLEFYEPLLVDFTPENSGLWEEVVLSGKLENCFKLIKSKKLREVLLWDGSELLFMNVMLKLFPDISSSTKPYELHYQMLKEDIGKDIISNIYQEFKNKSVVSGFGSPDNWGKISVAKIAYKFKSYLRAQNIEDEWHQSKFPPQINNDTGVIRYIDDRGRFHRLDGPARIDNDAKEWWINDRLHRKDGPAVESPDNILYYRDGRLHRLTGPAYSLINGLRGEWWVRDNQLDDEHIKQLQQKNQEVLTLIKNPGTRNLMDEALQEGNKWLNVPIGECPAKEVFQDLMLEKGLIPEINPSPRGEAFRNFMNIRDYLEIYQEMLDHKMI